MDSPLVDDRHQDLKLIVQAVSMIFFSDEFASLRKELELLYARSGKDAAPMLAFQDALYCILAQEELAFEKVRAY